jgi:hypothetical protein
MTSPYLAKCKRLRTDGPTPCLCCPGECVGDDPTIQMLPEVEAMLQAAERRWLPHCPFRYRPKRRRYSFGVAGGFLDYIDECERKAEADYNAKYVTCWDRFLHWLGWH